MTITRNFSVLANGAGSANNLSLGGATLGSNALAVTGTTLLNSTLTAAAANFSGAITAAGTGGTLAATISMNANTTGEPAYFAAGGTDTNVGIDLNTKGTGSLRLNVNSTVAVTVANGGKVGIGTTSPSSMLDIVQAQNAPTGITIANSNTGASARSQLSLGGAVSIFTSSSGYSPTGPYAASQFVIQSYATNGLLFIAQNSGAPLIFGINTSEAGRFGTDRSFLIGTTTNAGAGNLRVSGSIATDSGIINAPSTNLNLNAGTGGYVIFAPNGGATGTGVLPAADNFYYLGYSPGYRWSAVYAVNGTIQTSDARRKTVLDKQRDFKSIINNIWVGDVINHSREDKLDMVFLAQQLHEHMPDNVITPKEEEGDWGVNYAGYVPLAMWGVKDLYKIIDELTTRLAALEAK